MNSGHTKYFNEDNIQVPSVTTIMKLLNNDSLQRWSNYIGFKRIKLDDLLGEYATIGTLTHKYIEEYLLRELRIIYPLGTNIERHAYIAYKNFLSWYREYKSKISIIKCEYKLIDNEYGGTIDCYCKFNNRYRIIDFKTSSDIHDTQFLQLGGYVNLLEVNGLQVDEVCILAVNKNKPNTYKIKIKSRDEIQPYIESFLALKDFYYKWNKI